MGAEGQAAGGEVGSGPGLGRLVGANLGFLGTFVLFAVVAVKTLVVSHFDLETSLGVAQAVGVGGFILGGVVVGMYPLILVAFSVWTLWSARRLPVQGRARVAAVSLVLPLLVFAVFLAPWFVWPIVAYQADALVDGPLIRLIGRSGARSARRKSANFSRQSDESMQRIEKLQERIEKLQERIEKLQERFDGGAEDEDALSLELEELRRDVEAENARIADSNAKMAESNAEMAKANARLHRGVMKLAVWSLLINFLVASVYLLDDRPWWPEVRVVMTHGGTQTGYVLREDATSVVLLEASSRRLEYVPRMQIRSKSYCEVKRSSGVRLWTRPLVSFIFPFRGAYRNCGS